MNMNCCHAEYVSDNATTNLELFYVRVIVKQLSIVKINLLITFRNIEMKDKTSETVKPNGMDIDIQYWTTSQVAGSHA